MAKKALGKGLGALIKKSGTTTPAASNIPSPQADLSEEKANNDKDRVLEAPIKEVVPSPMQPRSHFTEQMLEDLMESIRQHGIIQPLIVRKVDGKYELIAGERRWRASQQLGLEKVPVIIREASDRDVLEMALIENLQREDLNPIEEAAGYVRLAREFELKQEEIASRVGKSRASVANAMRLLDLHQDVQAMVSHQQLSVGHAKAILSLKDHETQKIAADYIARKSLTVRASERFVKDYHKETSGQSKGGKTNGSGNSEADAMVRSIQNKLRNHFATHVTVNHSNKKGKIEIEYYGNDDMQRILDLLGLPSDSI